MPRKATPIMSKRLDGCDVTVANIRKVSGIAGQVTVAADVSYVFDDGTTDGPNVWQLVGHVHGGPVVTIMSNGRQVFVANHERFGSFGADPVEYMRRFALNDEQW